MANKIVKKTKPKSLSHGRPPVVTKPKASLSAKATRTLIRSHHRLHKALADAERNGDTDAACSIRQQIEDLGGLKSYQQASIQGQSGDRGGDTSKLLIEWLSDFKPTSSKLRMLEVGALSIDNACSKSGLFEVTRIDLNSQGPGIQEQDFMERPLPKSDADTFDIISLSLVVNYVPEAVGRGQMLARTRSFLRPLAGLPETERKHFPAIFLVLPAPCVMNSRYLDEKLLRQIMQALGYTMIQKKLSSKLIYYLWRLETDAPAKKVRFPKQEVNPGRTRNNFCIILE